MFEWLFPTWSNPAVVAAVVALRLLVDVGVVGLVAETAGRRSRLAAGAAAMTLLAAALMVSVLLPGGPGRAVATVELGLSVGLLVLAGYAVRTDPSIRRWLSFALVAVAGGLLLLPAVVLYGEATVAP